MITGNVYDNRVLDTNGKINYTVGIVSGLIANK
jgi:hypothetical protein